MDVLAHTLWTNVVFHIKYPSQRKWRYLAAFFGVIPDLIGFTPLFVYLILSGQFNKEWFMLHNSHWTFRFAEQAYNYTHSVVIFAAVFILIIIIGTTYYWQKNKLIFKWWIFWPLFGWLLHILIDIPTHPDFYRTPFLFPLSEYRVPFGISWAHPVFMLVNYGLLIIIYSLLFNFARKNRIKKINEQIRNSTVS